MDGKHGVIKAPTNSGSEFINYKGSFSIELLAVINYDYFFRYLNVSANGGCSDEYTETLLKSTIDNNFLNLPKKGYFVSDDSFSLTKYIIKPYCRRKLSK